MAIPAFLVAASLLTPTPPARPAAAPQALVHRYFEAVARGDFRGAMRLTTGEATASTSELAGAVAKAAAQSHARVEMKLRKLEMKTIAATRGGAVVDAAFHIDVVGHKWIFSKVGKRVDGNAHFIVAGADPHIVRIDGHLD